MDVNMIHDSDLTCVGVDTTRGVLPYPYYPLQDASHLNYAVHLRRFNYKTYCIISTLTTLFMKEFAFYFWSIW